MAKSRPQETVAKAAKKKQTTKHEKATKNKKKPLGRTDKLTYFNGGGKLESSLKIGVLPDGKLKYTISKMTGYKHRLSRQVHGQSFSLYLEDVHHSRIVVPDYKQAVPGVPVEVNIRIDKCTYVNIIFEGVGARCKIVENFTKCKNITIEMINVQDNSDMLFEVPFNSLPSVDMKVKLMYSRIIPAKPSTPYFTYKVHQLGNIERTIDVPEYLYLVTRSNAAKSEDILKPDTGESVINDYTDHMLRPDRTSGSIYRSWYENIFDAGTKASLIKNLAGRDNNEYRTFRIPKDFIKTCQRINSIDYITDFCEQKKRLVERLKKGYLKKEWGLFGNEYTENIMENAEELTREHVNGGFYWHNRFRKKKVPISEYDEVGDKLFRDVLVDSIDLFDKGYNSGAAWEVYLQVELSHKLKAAFEIGNYIREIKYLEYAENYETKRDLSCDFAFTLRNGMYEDSVVAIELKTQAFGGNIAGDTLAVSVMKDVRKMLHLSEKCKFKYVVAIVKQLDGENKKQIEDIQKKLPFDSISENIVRSECHGGWFILQINVARLERVIIDKKIAERAIIKKAIKNGLLKSPCPDNLAEITRESYLNGTRCSKHEKCTTTCKKDCSKSHCPDYCLAKSLLNWTRGTGIIQELDETEKSLKQILDREIAKINKQNPQKTSAATQSSSILVPVPRKPKRSNVEISK